MLAQTPFVSFGTRRLTNSNIKSMKCIITNSTRSDYRTVHPVIAISNHKDKRGNTFTTVLTPSTKLNGKDVRLVKRREP